MIDVLSSEKVVGLASAIVDGQHPDWDAAESSAADEGERALIRQLRAACDIGRGRAALYTSSLVSEALGPRSAVESGATWGTLRILEKVGRGRFGDVYRAWDPSLDREVALKLLRRRAVAGSPVDTDVIEEGRLMARVRHPNVATIYGAQHIAGVTGLWMEFVRGRTLEAELATRGPFSAKELEEVATDLCHALQAVHDAGLVHRDLKAQNVMRDESGRVVLGDFGTGCELDRTTGELAGTPAYVAPELFDGGVATARSDIYSLGVLLHHLATGAFPVAASSIEALRDAHGRGMRTSVAELRPDLPSDLAAAIDRASALDPTMRFDSAAALRSALRPGARTDNSGAALLRFRATAAVVVAVATVFGWWALASRAPGPPTPRWVLVGAFDNATGDRRLDQLLEVALERELAQSHALSIVARERIVDTLRLMRRDMTASLDPATAREICLRDGEIGLFATGRIGRVGKGYELDVTVRESNTGASIIHASVEIGALEDVLDGVRTVASRIRNAVGERRQQVETDLRLERVTTGSLDALRAYTNGVGFVNERRWAAAELPLRDAIRIDAGFAAAHIMLAYCLNNQRRPAADYLPFAQRALEMSDNLPSREKYFIVGSYYDLIGDREKSIAPFEALVREHPTDFWGVNNLIIVYHETGRYRDAIPLIARFAALRPNDFTTLFEAAQLAIVSAGDVRLARQLVDRTAPLQRPSWPRAELWAAWIRVFPAFDLWSKRQVKEAAAALDTIALDAPGNSDTAVAIGLMNLAMCRVTAAEDAFRSIPHQSQRHAFLAAAALARGSVDGARAAIRAVPNLVEATSADPARNVFGKATFILWTMLRSGLVKDAEAYAARALPSADPSGWLEAELAAARGELDAAIPRLAGAIKQLAPGNRETLIAVETLGTALIERGDLHAAREVLLSAGDAATTYHGSGSRGFIWLRIRSRLLWLERRLGHAARAQEIEQELEELLQVADGDCRNSLMQLR